MSAPTALGQPPTAHISVKGNSQTQPVPASEGRARLRERLWGSWTGGRKGLRLSPGGSEAP